MMNLSFLFLHLNCIKILTSFVLFIMWHILCKLYKRHDYQELPLILFDLVIGWN